VSGPIELSLPAAALRLRRLLVLRAARAESIGILRQWGGLSTEQATGEFDTDCIGSTSIAEADRLRGQVDAAAHGRSDPDWP
jgi:hypothetical protein